MQLHFKQTKQIYIGKLNTSDIELRDLGKAWVATSLAFALVMRGFADLSFYQVFIISAITVGCGFLLHELAHKFVAQRYGCFAEFRSFDPMLLLAVVMAAFTPFLFAAPGAVMIAGRVDTRKNGIISVAGPITNLVLAMVFLSMAFLFSDGFIRILSVYGFFINSWLALFNMIPIWNLDGAKVLRWNKVVFGIVVAFALLFMFMQNFVRGL